MRTLLLLRLLFVPGCKLATNEELYQARDFDRLLLRAYFDEDREAFRLYQRLAKEHPAVMRQRHLDARRAAIGLRWRMHQAHHRATHRHAHR